MESLRSYHPWGRHEKLTYFSGTFRCFQQACEEEIKIQIKWMSWSKRTLSVGIFSNTLENILITATDGGNTLIADEFRVVFTQSWLVENTLSTSDGFISIRILGLLCRCWRWIHWMHQRTDGVVYRDKNISNSLVSVRLASDEGNQRITWRSW